MASPQFDSFERERAAWMGRYFWVPDYPDETGWKKRHTFAMHNPLEIELPITGLLKFWLQYAAVLEERHGWRIGDDNALGPIWADMGMNIRKLLDGPTGQLDCGTLDTIICNMLRDQGFDPDTM